ncbi:unnamed protein product [Bursaphelenchus xylophilus]|nr:unnamed protein product [Bursaphelenchus xylophilus]CAG9130924.1 unnamed protein product [Bursaphelenchus xylophilus]
MAANKVEMSLDDIIKGTRKDKKGNGPVKRSGGPRKGPIKKKSFKPKGNNAAAKVTPATKKLVNALVKKALAKRGLRNVDQSPRKTFVRKVNPRSRVIKKRTGGGQTETVVIRKIQRPVQKPRVIREVIVEEPRRRFVRPAQRVIEQRPRQKVVYVQQQQPQRRRFNNSRRRTDPFYEPANYLQRI